MRLLVAFFLAISLLTLPSLSQNAAQKAQPIRAPRGPILTEQDGKPVVGVRLARADVNAVVHGNLAQATMILTFANDQARVLGGNLVFPLPEGATVTGYGLDINGVIVDGVAVEKERARIIYESELHKNVDPGLVEHVEGNAFRTRLYPIPANGTRSIKIEYVTQIEQAKDGALLSLPLGFGDSVDELSIRLEAPELTASPIVKAGGIDGLTFEKAARGFAANASAKKVKCGEELVIAIPQIPERCVAVEKRLKIARTIEDLEGRDRAVDANAFEHYFVATDTPAVAPRQMVQLKNHRIGVVWDASLSRGDSDRARETKLLEAMLAHLGNPSTDLIVVRNDVEVRPLFASGAEGTAKLIETLKALPYDGATNLGSLILPKNVADYPKAASKGAVADYDLFLMFSDGFGNLGADRPLRAEAPVYAFCDDVRVNGPLLRAICQESGGSYFNLKRATDDQVINTVGDAPFSLIGVECEGISDVYPPIGTAVSGRFTVSGKLTGAQGTLTLKYGYGREVTSTQTFTIKASDASEGSLLPRFWAQQKVAALSLFPEKNAEELGKIGKQFNLVTPNTSLLVLETADQYVQYRVVPPPTRPDVYKEFLAKIEQHRVQEAQTQEQKLAQVAAMWNARVQWWEKEYKYPADLKVKEEGKKDLAAATGAGLAPHPVASPRPLVSDAPAPSTPAPVPQDVAGQQAQGGQHNAAMPRAPHAPGRSPDANSPTAAAHPLNEAREALGEDRRRGTDPAADSERSVRQRRMDRLDDRIGALDAAKSEKDQKATEEQSLALEVAIKQWDPKTPYLAAMKAVAPEKAYGVYLAQRKDYAKSPAFYFDCADYLVRIGQNELGVRVLSDIVELELHDARLIRVAAHRLNQIGQRELAIDLFEKVLKLRPEEPQSYRDLALTLADRADASVEQGMMANNGPAASELLDRAQMDYMRALQLLNKVVMGNWSRFPEVELPVLMEANNISAKAHRLPAKHDFADPVAERLRKNLECDVRVVMTWDADQTDIDLWVTEPSGEKCFYGHNRTIIGGLLSHDFTDGYGPEEYCLRKLMPGQYLIQANFYGSRQQELTGPATVQATVITDFGRPNEKRQALTLRLKEAKEVVTIGTVNLGGTAQVKPAGELNK